MQDFLTANDDFGGNAPTRITHRMPDTNQRCDWHIRSEDIEQRRAGDLVASSYPERYVATDKPFKGESSCCLKSFHDGEHITEGHAFRRSRGDRGDFANGAFTDQDRWYQGSLRRSIVQQDPFDPSADKTTRRRRVTTAWS